MKNHETELNYTKLHGAHATKHTRSATPGWAMALALFALFTLFALGGRQATAQSLKLSDEREYGDLSELELPARIYVEATPDAYLREAIVKELGRHPELVEVVGRPEDAQAYLVYYGPGIEGGDSLLPSEGVGEVSLSGTLILFRHVETCDGLRPRQLFIDRKTKSVRAGIVLPLMSLNQLAEAGPGGPRMPSGKAVSIELVVRLGLFLLHKKYPGAVDFDNTTNTLALSFGQKAEKATVQNLVKGLEEVRKMRPYVGAWPVPGWLGTNGPAGPSPVSGFSGVAEARLPCPQKQVRQPPKADGEAQPALVLEPEISLERPRLAEPSLPAVVTVRADAKRAGSTKTRRAARARRRH